MHHFEDGIQFTQMLFNFDALETVAHSDTPSVPYISKNWYKEYANIYGNVVDGNTQRIWLIESKYTQIIYKLYIEFRNEAQSFSLRFAGVTEIFR